MGSSWPTIHRFFPLLQVFNIFKILVSQSDLAEIESLVAKILECIHFILFFFLLRNHMKNTLKSAERSKADPVVIISPSAWEICKILHRQSTGLFNLYKAVRGKKKKRRLK